MASPNSVKWEFQKMKNVIIYVGIMQLILLNLSENHQSWQYLYLLILDLGVTGIINTLNQLPFILISYGAIFILFSGIIALCKNIVIGENADFTVLLNGIKNNWRYIAIATFAFYLPLKLIQITFMSASMMYLNQYIGPTITSMIEYFFLFLLIYGSFVIVEYGFGYINLFNEFKRKLSSVKTLKILGIIAFISIIRTALMAPAYNLFAFKLSEQLMRGGLNPDSLTQIYPSWILVLQVVANSLIFGLLIIYSASLFYNEK